MFGCHGNMKIIKGQPTTPPAVHLFAILKMFCGRPTVIELMLELDKGPVSHSAELLLGQLCLKSG
jgi:hypothetical protein